MQIKYRDKNTPYFKILGVGTMERYSGLKLLVILLFHNAFEFELWKGILGTNQEFPFKMKLSVSIADV